MASFQLSGLSSYPYRTKFSGSGSRPEYDTPWSYSSVKDFNRWYQGKISGIGAFKRRCGKVLDQVAGIMRNDTELSVEEIIKGGSLGKGTMMKDISDIDCVVMINNPDLPYLKDVSDMSTYVNIDLAKVNKSIVKALKDNAAVVDIIRNKYMVKATLRVSGASIHVDLIPTADNCPNAGYQKVGKRKKKKQKKRVWLELYESMIARKKDDREFYSPSLVKLQIEFIKFQPPAVKELIRLVKFWNAQVVGSVLKGKGPLPTSYPMELITILAWERAGSPSRFKRLRGFKAVLGIIASELPTLEKYWTKHYDESVVQRARSVMDHQTKQRPFILDPANPTNNVCARFHDTWNDVAGVARQTLRCNLLRELPDSPGWK